MTIDTIIETGIAQIIDDLLVDIMLDQYEQQLDHAASEVYEGPWDACITALEEQGGYL